ncbi:hypothetical protein [Thermoplasma volcanium]|nr:hypothetical protein [Thermoplasma volcanium]
MQDFINYVRTLPKNKYYDIYFPLLFIDTELDRIQESVYGMEDWIYSFSKDLKWVPRRTDCPATPLYYKKIVVSTPYMVHLNRLFDKEKMILKQASWEWMKPEIRKKYGSIENFIKERRNDFKTDFGEHNTLYYDESKFCKLPRVLERFRGMKSEDIIKQKTYEINNGIFPDLL